MASAVAGLSGWRAAMVSAGAGAVSVGAFAPLHVWPVLFLTVPVLVWLLDGRCAPQAGTGTHNRVARAATIGWWFGFGFFLIGLYWIGHAFLVEADKFAWLLPFAVSLMPAGLALFFAAAAALAALLWRPGAGRVLALALTLTVTEWLRGHMLTGFPWIALGYTVTGSDAMMQWASVFGVHGLTWFAVVVFASPAAIWAPEAMLAPSRRSRLLLPALALALLAAATLWGAWRLQSADGGVVEGVTLRIVQPNIPQAEKWRDGNQARIFQTYLDLSAGGGSVPPLEEVTHLIWPESAVPFLLADSPEALQALAALLPSGVTFLTGALRLEEGGDGRKVYNSVLAYDDEARLLAVYDKTHLVPFGEYLPFQETLEAVGLTQLTGVRGGFTAGSGPRSMTVPGVPAFVPLICYEIIFPSAVRAPDTDPQWMLNVTNDGWFGFSIGPFQHLHQARVRAVEEGLPVVRVANTGVSALIDPHGRIVASLALGVGGTMDVALPRSIARPPYARWGRLIELAVLALALGAWLAAAGRRRTRLPVR